MFCITLSSLCAEIFRSFSLDSSNQSSRLQIRKDDGSSGPGPLACFLLGKRGRDDDSSERGQQQRQQYASFSSSSSSSLSPSYSLSFANDCGCLAMLPSFFSDCGAWKQTRNDDFFLVNRNRSSNTESAVSAFILCCSLHVVPPLSEVKIGVHAILFCNGYMMLLPGSTVVMCSRGNIGRSGQKQQQQQQQRRVLTSPLLFDSWQEATHFVFGESPNALRLGATHWIVAPTFMARRTSENVSLVSFLSSSTSKRSSSSSCLKQHTNETNATAATVSFVIHTKKKRRVQRQQPRRSQRSQRSQRPATS